MITQELAIHKIEKALCTIFSRSTLTQIHNDTHFKYLCDIIDDIYKYPNDCYKSFDTKNKTLFKVHTKNFESVILDICLWYAFDIPLESGVYSSYPDALSHKRIVDIVYSYNLECILLERIKNHDNSKLEEPELSGYDKYVPMLKKYKYGTPEYTNIRNMMTTNCFAHHAQENSHHPEHYENGIDDMDLLDVFEMFIDWYSASVTSDTDFDKGLELNRERFNMSSQLYNIFNNTYERYCKNK